MDLPIKEQIRIVLVGKTGVGKSTSGNTILGKEVFHEDSSSKSVTRQCMKASETIGDKEITVVDTPGWCDTDLSEEELTEETVKCIDMSYPGPHVFLLVLSIGRFTEEEKQTVQKLQEIFGEGAIKYTMILFTRGDDLRRKSIDDYLRGATAVLKTLVEQCEGRYHVFDNKDESRHQVSALLQKIQDMVKDNNGQHFSSTTYQMLEEHIKRQTDLQQHMQAAEREKEIKAAELQRIIEQFDQEKQQQQTLRESQLQEQLRLLEAEKLKMSCLQMEEQKQREEELKHQYDMKENELKKKNQEHNHRMEEEIRRLKQENQKILTILKELQKQQELPKLNTSPCNIL